MELYPRWLDQHEREEGENPPLGLILCSDKSQEHIELLQLDKSGIRVAQYLTELPSPDVLHKRLHLALTNARSRLETEPSSKKRSP